MKEIILELAAFCCSKGQMMQWRRKLMSGGQILFADLLGDAIEFVKLPEQGCTSEVRKVGTPDGIYIMKSATKFKYREWLKSEAEVLQALSCQNSIPVPKYFDFIEEEDASHLLMSFEDGITLTAAIKNAGTMKEKQRLVRSFGQFINLLHEQEAVLESETDWLKTQLARARVYAESGQADGA
ncbi:phosphotransferase [Mesobacillus thioparans]|uniref:phosphotransferase n=1 Tax=Mesobacillus thioparans TaxID=370439 RepID=UPI0039EF7EE6